MARKSTYMCVANEHTYAWQTTHRSCDSAQMRDRKTRIRRYKTNAFGTYMTVLYDISTKAWIYKTRMRYKYNKDVAIAREYVEIKARICRKDDIYV